MPLFEYQRRVAFSDTDAMGVAHHASYVRYMEEARVAWMRDRGLGHTHFPRADRVLAVLDFFVRHFRPCTFEDLLTIQVQARRQGGRIAFQYTIGRDGERIAEGQTVHIQVDGKLKPLRPNPELVAQLEREPWIETLLSNS